MDWARWVGRLGDIVTASTLLFITLPLMAIVAIGIKCDSKGPVFVREQRVDQRGHRFLALRFRVMAYQEQPAPLGHPEVTFVGSLLRSLRIDSLPQLVNVLRGAMTCDAGNQWRLFFLE